MKLNLSKYGQYKNDIFLKLNFDFIPGKQILDCGCGDGSDAQIFVNEYKLDTYGIDIYEHNSIKKINGFNFKKANIYDIPYVDSTFDYVFLHDVLRHIVEVDQGIEQQKKALIEIKRVCKSGGSIIIVEANRYNPLFYPHMVKKLGHNHFKQSYFKSIINEIFSVAIFKYFEAHFYPQRYLKFWKIYEKIMESIMPKSILAYNVSIITK